MTLPTVFSSSGLLLLIAAAGCGEGGEPEPVDSPAAQAEARTGVPLAQEGATVTLVLPDSAAVGTVIPIELRVKNETSAPLDLYLRGREITFDVTIVDSSGDAVWRRLEGEVVPAILQLRTLAPGEVLRLTAAWDQRSRRGTQVPPGHYSVRGAVLTDGERTLESPSVPLEIGNEPAARGRPG